MQKTTLDYVRDLPQPSPDFNNLLAVLRCEVPARTTLFEFFLNDRLYSALTAHLKLDPEEAYANNRRMMHAYHRAGYDYAMVILPGFRFESAEQDKANTKSLNEGAVIHDRASFEAYPWPDPEQAETGILDVLAGDLPEGMKLIPFSPEGVLENTIRLVGYEPLCFLLADDPALAGNIFDAVGSRLLRYYERVMPHPVVGACMVNDDWGYKTQTMLSTRQMRKYVFPWHKRIVEAAHAADKPAILHSCGHFERIIDDVIDDMEFDGRHSFEDAIMPIEQAYERYHMRIAQLGGIDVDYMCRANTDDVYARTRALIEQTAARGGYAVGTGNSVPDYVPDESYFTMLRAVFDARQAS